MWAELCEDRQQDFAQMQKAETNICMGVMGASLQWILRAEGSRISLGYEGEYEGDYVFSLEITLPHTVLDTHTITNVRSAAGLHAQHSTPIFSSQVQPWGIRQPTIAANAVLKVGGQRRLHIQVV